MRSPTRGPRSVDVYLFPSVVGGGLGDIEEVLAAGRHLAGAGFRVSLYRRRGRALPPSVDGPWEWPPLQRVDRIRRRGPAALTVSASWGVSAAPAVPGPYGRAGPWAEEAAAVEAAYGSSRTIHVSLEEFARTLDSERESRERLREGGVASRAIPRRLERVRSDGAVTEFLTAFRRFRAFDRPNVLHLFATFRPDRRFSREHPSAVQTGPLRSGHAWPARTHRPRSKEWVWYASPASSEAIAPEVVDGLASAAEPPHLFVRAPRAWAALRAASRLSVHTRPLGGPDWRRRFASADVRIVTGSRSLLEALEVPGPFLYFNGVIGRGRSRRRHRPEKIHEFLRLARTANWPEELLRDLSDFSRGRRVRSVVARAARRQGAWRRFPSAPVPRGFTPPFDDPARLLVAVGRALAEPGADAVELVAGLRRDSHP